MSERDQLRARQTLETYIIRSGDPARGEPTWQQAMDALDVLTAGVRVAPSREAIVVEMENEGVVTWGDPRHRARFLEVAPSPEESIWPEPLTEEQERDLTDSIVGSIPARVAPSTDALLDVRHEEDGSWSVSIRAMPGHVGAAMTLEEAYVEAHDAALAWVEAARAPSPDAPLEQRTYTDEERERGARFLLAPSPDAPESCRFCGGPHASYTCPGAASRPSPDAPGAYDAMVAEFVGVESALSEALSRVKRALALAALPPRDAPGLREERLALDAMLRADTDRCLTTEHAVRLLRAALAASPVPFPDAPGPENDLRARLAVFARLMEAEWYNGNMDEGAYLRLNADLTGLVAAYIPAALPPRDALDVDAYLDSISVMTAEELRRRWPASVERLLREHGDPSKEPTDG